jgi:hypothetical protein
VQKYSLIIDRGRFDGNFRTAYIASILREKNNNKIIVLAYKNNDDEKFKIYKDLGADKIIFLKEEQKKIKNIYLIFLTAIYSLVYSVLLYRLYLKEKITKLHFKGIKIGDLILDHSIRFDNDFYRKNNYNTYLLKILTSSIYKILFFKKLFKENQISFTITSSLSYATLSSIGTRFSLKNKARLIFSGGSELKSFKNYNETLNGSFHIGKKNINAFIKNKLNQKKVEKYFFSRISAKKIMLKKNYMKILKKEKWDIFRAFNNKENFSKNKLYSKLNFKDLDKPLCVFALHAFKDANHIYGDFIFESFYDEFLKTIKFLKGKDNFYWAVKPHPAGDRLGENKIVEKLINRLSATNIKIIPKNISTKTIILHADKIITSRGTIGLEYAAIGKKPILTSKTYYSNFGIVLQCKSQSDYYFNILDNKFPKKLDNNGRLLAKAILYKRKFEYIKKNIFNITSPEVETGKIKFLKSYEKKLRQLKNPKNKLRKLYLQILKNEKII